MGSVLAIDLPRNTSGYYYTDTIGREVYKAGLQAGILFRPLGNVLYTVPPLCTNSVQLNQIYQVMEDLLMRYSKP
jgi:adenosylmethionine-8-amino-7-oxononanoate aminotransferase